MSGDDDFFYESDFFVSFFFVFWKIKNSVAARRREMKNECDTADIMKKKRTYANNK